MAKAAPPPAFSLSTSRRVRHWVDGFAIGSEFFVRDSLRRVRAADEVLRHRLAHAEPAPEGLALCCWRRLRLLRN